MQTPYGDDGGRRRLPRAGETAGGGGEGGDSTDGGGRQSRQSRQSRPPSPPTVPPCVKAIVGLIADGDSGADGWSVVQRGGNTRHPVGGRLDQEKITLAQHNTNT